MLVQQQIESALKAALQPAHLEVANESHMHSVPPDSETHFRIVAVSELFSGERRVARHQRIYQLLEAQLAGPVHALALHLYSPAEWRERGGESPASPQCRGGSRAEVSR